MWGERKGNVMKLRNSVWVVVLLLAGAACGGESEEIQPPPSPDLSLVNVVEDPSYECVNHADCELTTVGEDGCANYTLFGEHCSESKIYVVNQEELVRRENLEMPIECESVMNVPTPHHDADCLMPMGQAACFQNKCVFARPIAVGPEPI